MREAYDGTPPAGLHGRFVAASAVGPADGSFSAPYGYSLTHALPP